MNNYDEHIKSELDEIGRYRMSNNGKMDEFHIHSMDSELRSEFNKLNKKVDLLITMMTLICWFIIVWGIVHIFI